MMPDNTVRNPLPGWNRIAALIAIPIVVLLGLAFIGAGRAREAARQTSCRGMLGKLQLAMSLYHEVHGSYPPAYIADANGKPMHSWRVLILPFLDAGAEYARYRFDEPWNSPNNRKIADLGLHRHFVCPSRPGGAEALTTDYVVVVGKETAFPGAAVTKPADIRDGLRDTILMTEMNNSGIHWMEPRDLDVSTMSFEVNACGAPSVSSPHPAGPAVVFGDRITSYRLQKTLKPSTLKGLLTIAGGEPLEKDKLLVGDRNSPYLIGE
jgi:hypothetical protein